MSNIWEPDFSSEAERPNLSAERERTIYGRESENGPRMLTMSLLVAVCVAAGIYAIAKFFS